MSVVSVWKCLAACKNAALVYMLYIIGLGLSDERDITVRGLEV